MGVVGGPECPSLASVSTPKSVSRVRLFHRGLLAFLAKVMGLGLPPILGAPLYSSAFLAQQGGFWTASGPPLPVPDFDFGL